MVNNITTLPQFPTLFFPPKNTHKNMHHLHLLATLISTFLLLYDAAAAAVSVNHRRLLHQPFFPLSQSFPPFPSPNPNPNPQPQPQLPKYPSSSLTPQNPFFPSLPSPPPPPPPPSTTTFATFPANISSLVLPSTSHPSHKHIKLISLIITLSLFTLLLFTSLLLLLCHHRCRKPLKTDSLRLFPPNTTPSDSKKPPPPPFPRRSPTPTSTSSEFLYLGTLVSSRDAAAPAPSLKDQNTPPASLNYQRLDSPDLHPLPPLPRSQIYHINPDNVAAAIDLDENEDEFFSPRGSTGNNGSPRRTRLSPPLTDLNKSRSLNSLNWVSPDYSPSVVPNSASPRSMLSKSPDSLVSFPGPLRRFTPLPPPARAFSPFSPSSTEDGGTRNCSPRPSDFFGIGKNPAPPTGPPELVAPSRKGSLGISESKNEETMKPKLKALHWDKVRASSDRAMVWDHLKTSSFQLNEEMIETLFVVNSTVNGKDNVRRSMIPETNQENAVLDPKKSQNISILLRALNVTVDEVCEALVEGNCDMLGTELLESLLRMGPTKEEERKLKSFKDESPFKLGTAEAFLRAVLDIPFAFKRVDAMLYIANFESEIEHLKRLFGTLELACNELKSTRMFRKLLEAVLKTGNRMNIGTNRGDAHAFKLDTLLKLVDIKGADGKTSLLHFVVQEIIRAEGSRLSGVDQNPNAEEDQSTLSDEVEYRKVGLQVVSKLSGELTNVKKAAAVDADVLTNDVAKLVNGVSKISEVVKLNEELPLKGRSGKFSDSMNEFLNKAETELGNIQAEEGIALSMVKGLTVFFHGDSAKEEAHPLRLFMVVRDFLSILDQVCKDVGKMNERTMISSRKPPIQMPVNRSLPQVFPGFSERQQSSSSDDETSSSF